MTKEGAPQNWGHSKVFEEVGVALDRGVTPSVFWNQWGLTDQAFAIARSRATKTMEAYEQHLHDKDIKAQRDKAGK